MKRLLTVLLILLGTSAFAQRAQDFNVAYFHRSVGLSMNTGCDPFNVDGGPRPFLGILDTMTLVEGGFDCNVRWWNINLNGAPGPTIYDSFNNGVCGLDEIVSGMYTGSSFKIWYNNSCPLLILFSDTSKASAAATGWGEQTVPFDVFGHHLIPTSATDSIAIKFDAVIVKQPYIVWEQFTQARSDMIKGFYLALRDTVWNHPELNFVAEFGTPLCFNENGSEDFESDTNKAKLVFDLAQWFDSVFVDNLKPWEGGGNFFGIDNYIGLTETSADSANRYCLKNLYWAGATSQSHLSVTGAHTMQELMVPQLKRIFRHISMRRPGNPGIHHKTNTSANLGWPMNVAQEFWPTNLTRTQPRADSITAAQDTTIVSRFDATTNCDYARANSIKATDSTFLIYEYNSFQDNYHEAGEEAVWLADTCAALGISVDRLYLHYKDSTVVVLDNGQTGQQPTDTVKDIPGLDNATTASDSLESRVLAYSSLKLRAVPNYSDSISRALHAGFGQYQLSRQASGFNYPPDGIFWDNWQVQFWNTGTVILGGHVAEAAANPLVSELGSGGTNWWYNNAMKLFGRQFWALIDTAANWSPGGKAKFFYGNTAGTPYDSIPINKSLRSCGQEGHPSIRFDYATTLVNYYNFDQLCRDSGVYNSWAPPVITTVPDGTGSYTFSEGMMNAYCYCLVITSDSSSISMLTNPGWSNFMQDTLVWIGAMGEYIGEQDSADAIYLIAQTGVDPDGRNYTIYKRKYGYQNQDIWVYFRPRGNYNQNIGASTQVTHTFDGSYRELRTDGTWGDPISSTTFTGGRGRIFAAVSGQIDPIASITLDTVALNFSGGLDSMMSIITFGSEALTGARAIFAHTYGSSYPDSSGPDTVGLAYVASTIDTAYWVEDFPEPRVDRASVWVKRQDATWSDRKVIALSIQDQSEPAAHIELQLSSLNFTASQNGFLPAGKTFRLANTGGGVMQFSITDDANWLSMTPDTGTSNNDTIAVNITNTGLSPGTYNATISIAATGADNTPQTIAVAYVVSAQATTSYVSRYRGAMVFQGNVVISKPGIPDPNDPDLPVEEPPAP